MREPAIGIEPDHAAAIDPMVFRAVCGSFATGVTVVTAASGDGFGGSTVNSFTSLTAEPPHVLVCLNTTAQTLRHIVHSGRFAVNILAAAQEDVARVFASKSSDKLDQVAWHTGSTGVPLLDGALATIECSLADTHDYFTHRILIGRVEHVDHSPTAAPLLFFRARMTPGAPLNGAVA
jgi:flavin reductase (DIM6/NTAB) family NADH-FMN oxidoreductase RutF